jgi:hypothetical protein
VASTVNSGEVETTFVVDEVAGDLTVGVPWSPGAGDAEVKALDPSAGALSGDCTIGITRVEEHLVVVLQEYFVDPERSLELETVLGGNLWAAHRPALNAVRNVKWTSDISAVNIVWQEITEKRLLSGIHWHVTNPTDVLLESETSFVGFDLISNLNGSLSWQSLSCFSDRTGNSWLGVNLSEEVIPVETLPQAVDFVP